MKCFETDLNEHQVNSYLQRISNYLMMNGGFLQNPGLFSGEMGLALFFARYAVFRQNELYSEYSFDLIEKIQNSIHQATPIDFKNGLTGIGSAIEYLVQRKFIKTDTDDILEELDNNIFSFFKMPHLSLDELLGIGFYALWRMSGGSVRTNMIQKKVLPKLVGIVRDRSGSIACEYRTVDFFEKLVETENLDLLNPSVLPPALKLCTDQYRYGYEVNRYKRFMEQIPKNELYDNKALDLGLQNGLAGFGMALMTKLDGDDSWLSLLPNDIIQLKNEPLPL